ncbi:hypothetical protein [Haloprofundus salinisoli]|uniref:hypothetical protein n=1 Tax=Haloprofundus salinisoli TaxID=2876193 RepID=UPI001CC9C312|nr:hypothetical protein [Haloprofundus salinisoli]
MEFGILAWDICREIYLTAVVTRYVRPVELRSALKASVRIAVTVVFDDAATGGDVQTRTGCEK